MLFLINKFIEYYADIQMSEAFSFMLYIRDFTICTFEVFKKLSGKMLEISSKC